MKLNPTDIFGEYSSGVEFKNMIGSKGLYEQIKINERFYTGDQWFGAKCGNDRPLVRHNIIKRIGDFKMAQITAAPVSVSFSADGVPLIEKSRRDIAAEKKQIALNPKFTFSGAVSSNEVNVVMSALSDYHRLTSERVGFDALCLTALRDAYISGTAVFYTYWDSEVNTGLYIDESTAVKGDIRCEVLKIQDVYFGDNYCESVEKQPYIILAARVSADELRREARANGSKTSSYIVPDDSDGKCLVLTKLYREAQKAGGYKIKCTKVTKNAVIREPFDTRLTRYPLAVFRFDGRRNEAHGESEITYLIPNQIAINRMITANVWSAISTGMPIMAVNGDTITGEITNEPGQIIKIYGSNEDVAGAVKYISPPESSAFFNENINNLIENTLTQSGANAAALGDSDPNNASALLTLRNAAIMPLSLVKNRFYTFVEEIARIWADFWVTQYGDRYIKVEDENGKWYLPFSASRYKNLSLNTRVEVGADNAYSVSENINTLVSLYEKGVIDKKQLIKRLPSGSLPDIRGLIDELEAEKEDTDEGE